MILNRILLVDDDIDDQEIFISVLKEIKPGVEYVTAKNGLEAMDYLIQAVPPPTLIFMDINMPVMNGLQCLAEIKRIHEFRDIPVVMLTTSSDPPTKKQSLKMGAKLFLTKVATVSEIKDQMRLVLGEEFITS